MSEEPSQPPRNKPLQNGGPMKLLSIWLLGFGLIIMLLWLSNQQLESELYRPKIIEVVTAAQAESSPIKEGAQLKPNPSGGRNWYQIKGTWEVDGEERPFEAQGNLTEDNLEILQQSALFEEQPASRFMEQLIISILPVLIIVAVLYFIFVRQLKNAGRGAMSFGKSKARMLMRDKEKITFQNVAGCDEAKEEVEEVVEFLRDPKRFQQIGGRIPKGVLLVGPPGTGKTLLARAVAGEADVPFFSISGSDFVEMFVGVGAARVRDMFEQGRKNAPCIIFIDEIDAVGRQRGAGLGGGNDEREQTLNSLLVEMDGFEGYEGVIIMAATNRADVLDNALTRPGRFDRQIMIDLPDLAGREEILRVHAKKIKLSKAVNLMEVARSTPGFAGADLANLLNESALLAARRRKEEVSAIDIDDARDKIAFGRERRKLMDEEDKRLTAFHEAGHALIQVLLKSKNLKLHKVTIIPRGRALGMAMSTPIKDVLGYSRKELLDRICITMGGRIGEELETHDYSNGASSDIQQATKLARHMVCDWGMSDLGPIAFGENQEHIFLAREMSRSVNYSEKTAQLIDQAIRDIVTAQFDRATQLIKEHEDALRKIAEALLEHETLEGIHVQEIVQHGEIRTPVVTATPAPPPDHEPDASPATPAKPGKEKDADIDPGAEPALA